MSADMRPRFRTHSTVGRNNTFEIQAREYLQEVPRFSYSLGRWVSGDRFVPAIDHADIPEAIEELKKLFETGEAQIKKAQEAREARLDARAKREAAQPPRWDQKVSKRDKKKFQNLGKTPKEDLAAADRRSEKEKERNKEMFTKT